MSITIRPLENVDMQRLWELRAKDEAPEWKKWDAPYFDTYKALTWEQFEHEQAERYLKNDRYYGIFHHAYLIGTVSYYWEHRPSNWLEMGIAIYDAEYWNGGFGTTALALWISHLFTTMPLVRVGYTTWSGNERMIAVGEKLGMTMEARLRKCRYYNGAYYDSIRMGILREEWEQFKILM